MNELSLDFLKNDAMLDDENDEFDAMASESLYVELPVNMIGSIMQAVSSLPKPRPLSQWKGYDFFVVEPDDDQLS